MTRLAVADPRHGLTYHDALAALAERGRFGIRLGLGRTRALLRELGDPQRSVRGALSPAPTARAASSPSPRRALRAAGLARRETPKPHLVTYRERIQVDGRPIAPTTSRGCVERVLAAADRVAPTPRRADRVRAADRRRLRALRRGPTWTSRSSRSASAGGSTRPTPGTAASPWSPTWTSTTWTGWATRSPTIAREKAAIIERGDLAVTGATGDGAGGHPPARAAARRAADRGRARRRSSAGTATASRSTCRGSGGPGSACAGGTRRPTSRSPTRSSTPWRRPGSPTVARRRPTARLRDAVWPGRLELLRVGGRDVLLDGAHNPAGAAALAVGARRPAARSWPRAR